MYARALGLLCASILFQNMASQIAAVTASHRHGIEFKHDRDFCVQLTFGRFMYVTVPAFLGSNPNV